MKIKKTIDLCKQSRNLILYKTDEGQYISDGFAVYPMTGMPTFDEDTIFRTFDINDKQKSKIFYTERYVLPQNVSFEDNIDEESVVDRSPMRLYYMGKCIVPYMTSAGVMFVDEKYLAPIADAEEDMITVCERRRTDGQIYFAVKAGFVLVAVIMPVDVINDLFVSTPSRTSARSR